MQLNRSCPFRSSLPWNPSFKTRKQNHARQQRMQRSSAHGGFATVATPTSAAARLPLPCLSNSRHSRLLSSGEDGEDRNVGLGGWPGLYFWFCRLYYILRGGDSDLSFVSIVASASFSTSNQDQAQHIVAANKKTGDENKNGQRYIQYTTLKILQLINAGARWVAWIGNTD
jgi:hypothetical protein